MNERTWSTPRNDEWWCESSKVGSRQVGAREKKGEEVGVDWMEKIVSAGSWIFPRAHSGRISSESSTCYSTSCQCVLLCFAFVAGGRLERSA